MVMVGLGTGIVAWQDAKCTLAFVEFLNCLRPRFGPLCRTGLISTKAVPFPLLVQFCDRASVDAGEKTTMSRFNFCFTGLVLVRTAHAYSKQDKLYKKQNGISTGPMVVFYGCRHEQENAHLPNI